MQWERVSDWCLRSDGYTVCKYGTVYGWRYESWHGKEQLAANLETADEAKEQCRNHAKALSSIETAIG